MRGRSVASRLDRLVDRSLAGDREALVREVAVEYGLSVAEVRTELVIVEEHTRQYGPSTLEQFVHRTAAELGLAEAALWAGVAVATGSSGGRA